MNLELIKKYEKEFLHMLHGGKVLIGKKDLVTNTTKWYTSVLNPFVETSESILIVIDDIYSTYRKALAEGKIVEANYNKWVFPKIPTKRWDTMAGEDFDRYGIDDLRIKPEEPEFKVGDWITVNGPAGTFTECVSGINDDTYTLSGTDICFKSQATKWEPKEGEICIFWDDNWVTKAIIIKFNYINNSNQYTAIDNICWDNCMPFTGVLPPHMKDN